MTVLFSGLFFSVLAIEPAAPLEGEIRPCLGRPTMHINGEPCAPVIYALTEHGRHTWKAVPRRNLEQFARAGYRLFQVDVWFRDIWSEDGSLDMDTVRRQVRGVVDVRPDAAVFIRLHVEAPGWWNRTHPDECVQYAKGPVDAAGGDLGRGLRSSLASEHWRDDASAQVVRFCRELSASREGNCVVGMHLAGGVFGEWHYWSFMDEPDTGPAMGRRFRGYLRERYGTDEALRAAWRDPSVTIETAEVPGWEPRLHTEDGVFRDPTVERRVIDYGRCHQLAVVEAVLHFCRLAKESWPRPLITGVFYGYYFGMLEMVAGGHLELGRVFESPFVDYLSAPFSYESDSRWMGGSGHLRGLAESARLNGKLWLNEMDQPTFLGCLHGTEPPMRPETESDTVAMVRRNFAQSLFRGHGMWWYDFGPAHSEEGAAGWWDTPALMEEARRLRLLAERATRLPYRPEADVLLVYDTSCFYCLGVPFDPDPLSFAVVNRTQALVHHAGVMSDSILLQDLPKAELDRYRVVVFAQTPVLTDEQAAYIHEQVATDGRTVVWSYAPGYSDGESLSVERLSSATGFCLSRTTLEANSVAIDTSGGPLPAMTYPSMEESANIPRCFYPIDRKVRPLFAVDDAAAEVLGWYSGTATPALARKRIRDATVWYTALPPLHSALLRAICRDAGAHLYVETDDAVLATDGMIALHSVTGGARRIRLRDGRALEVTLPPRSTTVLDTASGQDLLASVAASMTVPVPAVRGPWTRIYAPRPAAFPGPDGPTLRAGQVYDDWIPNDHTFVQDAAGVWHCFGITGPASPVIHEAEWQAFHISGRVGEPLWAEHDLVLTPAARPGDRNELWAPFVVEREGAYHMFYGPHRMGHAISTDLFSWRPVPPAFEQEGSARDPWIVTIDGRYHMVYVAGDAVWMRTSADLTAWSEPDAPLFAMRRPGHPESPMLVPYEARYYLFWTIYDGTNTANDNRTFVYVSETLDGFADATEVTQIEAHAPELFEDDGQWYISTAERPERGISIAPLDWVYRDVPRDGAVERGGGR